MNNSEWFEKAKESLDGAYGFEDELEIKKQLIAYCEELRVISTISETQISNLATLGERLEEENVRLKDDVRWAEESEMGVVKERDFLKEENEKLSDANRILKEEMDALNTAVGYHIYKYRWIGT